MRHLSSALISVLRVWVGPRLLVRLMKLVVAIIAITVTLTSILSEGDLYGFHIVALVVLSLYSTIDLFSTSIPRPEDEFKKRASQTADSSTRVARTRQKRKEKGATAGIAEQELLESRAVSTIGYTAQNSNADGIDDRVVSILFATNREARRNVDRVLFTGERADAVSWGAVSVRVPEVHRIGKIETPIKLSILSLTIYEQVEEQEKHFVIQNVETLSQDDWRALISRSGNSDAFVFVHGFNTSFDEASRRCAQVVWDLQLSALPFLFSWPSRGEVIQYLYDRDSSSGARHFFAEFLGTIAQASNIKRIHILAHSMGNSVLLEGLKGAGSNAGKLKLGEVMMAAPDVDAAIFRELAESARRSVRGMTLYASAVDKALVASRRIAGNMPRAGDVFNGEPLVVTGVETIDVTALGSELLGLNHGTFASARSILNDVALLINSGARPPHARLADIRSVPDRAETPRYWRYAK